MLSRFTTVPSAFFNRTAMPRLTLQRKVFLALAALLVALLLIFVGLSRLGLQRGLGDYVAEIELSRMDWLARRLELLYAAQGSWDFLRNDPGAWHAAQMRDDRGGGEKAPVRQAQQGPQGPPPPPGAQQPPPPQAPAGGPPRGPGGPRSQPQLDLLPERYAPPPPPDVPGDPRARADLVYARLALLDASGRQQLAGQPRDLGTLVKTPLLHGGATVGWLAIAPLQGTQSAADKAFVAQQSSFVVWSALAGLALALLISWWLTRRWLAPVRQLVQGAQAVAQGRLETQLPVQGRDELAVLTQTFNDMAQRLAHTETSRQHWLADVAHELRTPLAAMRAEIEALQDGVRSFDARTAQRLHGQVMRLGQLVDDLRLSMGESGGAPALQFELAQPVNLLLEAVALMRERLAAARIDVDTTALQLLAGPQSPEIDVDAARLHQVFANLLENTLRYTHSGGRLVLAARVEPGPEAPQLRLSFDDTAPAPGPQELPRLFERFYRAEASRSRAHGGSGLGLAICRALVEAHGGSITAEPSSLGGLRIVLSLPLPG